MKEKQVDKQKGEEGDKKWRGERGGKGKDYRGNRKRRCGVNIKKRMLDVGHEGHMKGRRIRKENRNKFSALSDFEFFILIF